MMLPITKRQYRDRNHHFNQGKAPHRAPGPDESLRELTDTWRPFYRDRPRIPAHRAGGRTLPG